MNNKDIKILENILENNSAEDILNEIENFSFNKQKNIDYIPYNSNELIVEMARINKRDSGPNALFPFNKFDIHIWSNDHAPAHFHVMSEGWDISFNINSGNLYRINKKGTNERIYTYIINNIKKWLNSECATLKNITNKENALNIWDSLH